VVEKDFLAGKGAEFLLCLISCCDYQGGGALKDMLKSFVGGLTAGTLAGVSIFCDFLLLVAGVKPSV
jgi:hypothetical protein